MRNRVKKKKEAWRIRSWVDDKRSVPTSLYEIFMYYVRYDGWAVVKIDPAKTND